MISRRQPSRRVRILEKRRRSSTRRWPPRRSSPPRRPIRSSLRTSSLPRSTLFNFRRRDPVSDAVQGPEGFYVLHLLGGTPARPLTLDEAKPKIVEAIKSERVRQLVSTKGTDTARVIREALAAGTPLDKAMAQIGVTVERIPPFSILESAPKPEKDKEPKVDAPDLPMIKNAVRELRLGESTQPVPTAKGGLVAVVENASRRTLLFTQV